MEPAEVEKYLSNAYIGYCRESIDNEPIFNEYPPMHYKKIRKLLDSEINRAQRFEYSIGLLELEVKDKFSEGVHHMLPGTTLNVEMLKGQLRSYDHVENTNVRRYTVMLPNIATLDDVEIVRKRIRRTAEHERWGAVNIGIAVYPFDGENADAILKKALADLQIN